MAGSLFLMPRLVSALSIKWGEDKALDFVTDLALAPLRRARRAARQRSGLDFWGRLVVVAGVAVAVYLIAAPLAMLLVTAFRGPVDLLPFGCCPASWRRSSSSAW